jgi:hypothetical protein
MNWAESLRLKVAPDVRFELERGEHAASINFVEPKTVGVIMIYESGMHEFYFETNDDVGTISGFVYGESIEPSQFEETFSPVTRRYLV